MPFQLSDRSRGQLVLHELDAHNRDLSVADRQRKYAKMAQSPYDFLRGTNHLYWHDVWHDWRYHLFGGEAETQTWLQGDAHVHNHGVYGHHAGDLRYGMDDFDDAFIADYQYDLWRHAISMVLDAGQNVSLSRDQTRRAIRHLLSTYLEELRLHRDGEPAHSADMENHRKPVGPFLRRIARKQGRERQLNKWTQVENGVRRFATGHKKLAPVDADTRERITGVLASDYRRTLDPAAAKRIPAHFHIRDIARRINAGIGSLGLLRYYVLLEGASESVDDDMILDLKQQTPPAAWCFMNDHEKRHWRETFPSEGERHAAAFRALADHSDDYLGWLVLDGKSFSVRERSPFKKSFPTHRINNFQEYRRLTRQWGRFMAREHIRGARALRPGNPGFFCEAVLDHCEARMEAFKEQVCAMAFSYSHCVEGDHAVFVRERG